MESYALLIAATLNAGDFSFDVAAQRRLTDGHRDNFASSVGGASFAAGPVMEQTPLGRGA